MEAFEQDVKERIMANAKNADLLTSADVFMRESTLPKYSYNFSWLGRPIIQLPQDIIAMQEIIWQVQPDLIIETGIAHGGSLIFSAAMLEINAVCGGPGDARVLGIDIDIRTHNREAIEAHPLFRRIDMIEGSSIAPDVIAQVQAQAAARAGSACWCVWTPTTPTTMYWQNWKHMRRWSLSAVIAWCSTP